MADEIDAANDLAAAESAAGVARARAAAGRAGPPPRGTCYSCEEHVPDPKIFCDRDCADDHAKARKRQF
jgi:hypothetical protein